MVSLIVRYHKILNHKIILLITEIELITLKLDMHLGSNFSAAIAAKMSVRFQSDRTTLNPHISSFRADSRFAPSQWETALLCNDVSHWLGASLESALSWLSGDLLVRLLTSVRLLTCLLNSGPVSYNTHKCSFFPQGKFKIFKSGFPHPMFVPWIKHDYSYKIYQHINPHLCKIGICKFLISLWSLVN